MNKKTTSNKNYPDGKMTLGEMQELFRKPKEAGALAHANFITHVSNKELELAYLNMLLQEDLLEPLQIYLRSKPGAWKGIFENKDHNHETWKGGLLTSYLVNLHRHHVYQLSSGKDLNKLPVLKFLLEHEETNTKDARGALLFILSRNLGHTAGGEYRENLHQMLDAIITRANPDTGLWQECQRALDEEKAGSDNTSLREFIKERKALVDVQKLRQDASKAIQPPRLRKL